MTRDKCLINTVICAVPYWHSSLQAPGMSTIPCHHILGMSLPSLTTENDSYLLLPSGISVLNDKTFDVYGNVTITPYTLGDASLTGFNATCDKAFTNLTTHKASFNSTVQKYLIVQRLGNLKDTGKFGVRYNTASGLKTFLNNNYPELVDLIYTNPTGADPHTPAAASLTALMNLYVESDLYLLTGAPAHLALYRRRLNLVRATGSIS